MTLPAALSNSGPDISQLAPRLLEAGLRGDRQRLELLTISAIRSLRKSYPELTKQLGSILAASGGPDSSIRWASSPPPPADRDTSAALLQLSEPNTAEEPILSATIKDAIERFIREREQAGKLLQEGLLPPRTLLLTGSPGTGKTMLASWIARSLHLPIAILDLATAISSFLGKTGFNLRRILDYGRSTPCVLFLDEFDAVAKRRDDETEVGELKRIVNVLLKELEDWPSHSVLIAATNHPEILDPAIPRRFDKTLELPLPTSEQRIDILRRAFAARAGDIQPEFLAVLSTMFESHSGSDIANFAQASTRRHIVDSQSLVDACLYELRSALPRRFKTAEAKKIILEMQRASGNSLTIRDISEVLGISPSTVHYHAKRKRKENQNAPK